MSALPSSAWRTQISAAQRVRQGLLLVAGAVALKVLVGGGTLEFFWTPLLLGLAYLAAALAGGRHGSYWATAPVLVGWGGVIVWLNEASPDVSQPAAYAFGMGMGVLLAGAVARTGQRVDLLGAGVTAAIAGLVFMLEPQVEVFGEATTFAEALAVVGLANLVLAAVSARRGRALGRG